MSTFYSIRGLPRSNLPAYLQVYFRSPSLSIFEIIFWIDCTHGRIHITIQDFTRSLIFPCHRFFKKIEGNNFKTQVLVSNDLPSIPTKILEKIPYHLILEPICIFIPKVYAADHTLERRQTAALLNPNSDSFNIVTSHDAPRRKSAPRTKFSALTSDSYPFN